MPTELDWCFSGDPSLSVVSAFLRSRCLESISLSSLYYFCIPNLNGGAISEPSIVAAVAFDCNVYTLRSLCSLFALLKTSPAFLAGFASMLVWLASAPSLGFADMAEGDCGALGSAPPPFSSSSA